MRSGLGAGAVVLVLICLACRVAVANAFDSEDMKGRFAFRMVPVKSFAADAPGDPADVAKASRQDILRVGFFDARPDELETGTLKGRTIATTDTNGGKTLVIEFNWRGFYTVNPDGTGVFTIVDPPSSAQRCFDSTALPAIPGPNPTPVPPPPPSVRCAADDEGYESYAFVLSRAGDDVVIDFIQTDNVIGGAKIFMTGQARLQKR